MSKSDPDFTVPGPAVGLTVALPEGMADGTGVAAGPLAQPHTIAAATINTNIIPG
jgi:hypothetical protein